MKKRILAAILLATITVSMIGCGSNTNTSNKTSSSATTDNNTEDNTEKEKATEPGSDLSDSFSYVPEYVRNMDCSKFDESMMPVQIEKGDGWVNIADLLAEDENGLLYDISFGSLDVAKTGKDIPRGHFDFADYTISILGQPSGICVSNFIPYVGYHEDDDYPDKRIVLIYEYPEYIITVSFLDIQYYRANKLTDIIDTAALDCVNIMTRDYFDNEFKNATLVYDATTNDTPIATYGSLEGFVPVNEE